MGDTKFSQWLRERGHDEEALRKDKVHGHPRLNQLMTFYEEEQAAGPPHPCLDADGQELRPGDLVTITYRVSATHPILDAETGTHKPRVAKLNLDRLLPGGAVQHAISVPSDQVRKAAPADQAKVFAPTA